MFVAGKVDSRDLGEPEMEESVACKRLKQDKRFENTVSLCQLTTSLTSFLFGSQTCLPTPRSILLPPSLGVTFLHLQLPASPLGEQRGSTCSQILLAETKFQPEVSEESM